jgi:PAS domain S-box-containing protein
MNDRMASPGALVGFFRDERDELLARWERATLSLPNERDLSRAELIDDLPDLLDRVIVGAVAKLEGRPPPPTVGSEIHGHHRMRSGVELWEVLAEMSLLRDCIVKLWRERFGEPPCAQVLALQAAIDQAVTVSVQSYVRERDRIQHGLERNVGERTEALHRIETLVSTHPDFFYLLDRDHRFLYVSPSLLRLWGVSADEALGKTFEELGYPPDLVRMHERQIDEALQGHVVRGGNPYTDPSGITRDYEYIFVPIRGDDGTIDTIAGVTRDVTEQKRHEAALSNAADSAEQLIAVLGHDLRTPLGAISMSAQTLLRAEDLPEQHMRALERIERSADRMARMVSDIVDWTRGRLGGGIPIDPHRTELGEVCEQVVAEVEAHHPGRKVQLERDEAVVGWWDFDRMAQVVQNLLVNAIVHGAPDTVPRLRIEAGEHEALIEVWNLGPPIPREELPRIFEPFSDTARAGRNRLGLGLYIVDAVVSAHGGRIDVTSTRSEGTTFTVHLPRHPVASMTRPSPQHPPSPT